MPKGIVYESTYPDNPPAWYWKNGLHDACITDVDFYEFPFDYDKYVIEKEKYNRNVFILKIDAKGAMFDTHVKEIRLYNYKIISSGIELTGRKKIWWLSDSLSIKNGSYILEIQLLGFERSPQEVTFKIKFDRAEVERD